MLAQSNGLFLGNTLMIVPIIRSENKRLGLSAFHSHLCHVEHFALLRFRFGANLLVFLDAIGSKVSAAQRASNQTVSAGSCKAWLSHWLSVARFVARFRLVQSSQRRFLSDGIEFSGWTSVCNRFLTWKNCFNTVRGEEKAFDYLWSRWKIPTFDRVRFVIRKFLSIINFVWCSETWPAPSIHCPGWKGSCCLRYSNTFQIIQPSTT